MTGPSADLQTLAKHLQGLIAAGQAIVLDASILDGDTVLAIATAYGLPAGGALSVAGVSSGPELAAGQLVVAGGQADLLAVPAVPVTVTFTTTTTGLGVLIAAVMPDGWSLAKSFTGLAGFPFDELTLTGAQFVFTSNDQSGYPWAPGPAGVVPLSAGQNLLSQVHLGGVSLLATLLDRALDGVTFPFYGPFAPTPGQVLPVGALAAGLTGGAGFSIGTGSNVLTLSDPAVVVVIEAGDPDTAPVQNIDLQLRGTFQQSLQVAVSLPVTGSQYSVSITPLPNQNSITSLIESLPGGAGFAELIPAELNSIFSAVGLNGFTMVVDDTPAVTYLGLAIGTAKPWPVIPDVLTLTGLTLSLELIDPAGRGWKLVRIDAQAQFLPTIFTGEFDFSVALDNGGGQGHWEVAGIAGSYVGAVDLGDLVAGLLGGPGSVPEVLRDITFSNFGVSATRSAPGQPFSYTGYGSADAVVPLAGGELIAQLEVTFSRTTTSYAITLAGSLVIGTEMFALALDLGTAGSQLTATWADPESPLEFGDIATALGWSGLPPIPGDLDLGLISAGFSYDFGAGAIVLTARSKNYGQLVFASQLVDKTRTYLFDLTVPLNVKLSDIPVAGPQIPPSVDVGIAQLEIAYGSAEFPAAAVTVLNTTLKTLGGTVLGYDSLAAGMVFVANLLLGGETQALTLPIGSPGPAPASDPAAVAAIGAGGGGGRHLAVTDAAVAADPATAPSSAGGKWFDVGKTFGPLQIQRIGIDYQNGTLIFELDASFAFGPLALSLQGLGVGSPLSAFSPVFSLNGLGLAYNKPPLEILGAILRLPASELAPGVEFQFDGTLVVKAEDFSLSAIGSYAQLDTGLPSLFVFAQLEAPLGGPPAFFVTGLMGGFGFNRTLTIPAQDEVAAFPLLLLAAPPPPGESNAQDPLLVLEVLEGTKAINGVTKQWITPRTGEYWLAAGLEFTSFELVTTKALLIAEFGGQDLAFALLGLSTLQLPLPVEGSQTYAYVELMIRVVLQPEQGSFAASAILSANSYVITPDCHLTGGFAFYLWFGNNPYAGQFVITLGGYHPAFAIPSYFPQVPRLGFNWAVSDVVSIKGDAYFALTGSCVMAGGGLQALFHSGDLQAWFTAQADFLVSWHPFFYTAQIAVSIGVSYRLNLGFCHKTITASLGADLEIWGPPTGGIVTVDLVVVSFSVKFGSDQAGTANGPLGWADFSALLPDPATVCTIAITNGLFKKQAAADETGNEVWVVRAHEFAFQTRSAIPVSELAYADTTRYQSTTSPTGIAIKPMNLTGVSSTHSLAIYREGSTTPVDSSAWSLQPLPQTVPASLWSAPPVPFSQIPAQPSADVLTGELSGFAVTAPAPQLGPSPGPVAVSLLMEDLLTPSGQAPLAGTVTASPDYLPTADQQTVGLIGQVMAAGPGQARSELFGVLTAAGYGAGEDGDLSLLAARADHLFSDSPLRQS